MRQCAEKIRLTPHGLLLALTGFFGGDVESDRFDVLIKRGGDSGNDLPVRAIQGIRDAQQGGKPGDNDAVFRRQGHVVAVLRAGERFAVIACGLRNNGNLFRWKRLPWKCTDKPGRPFMVSGAIAGLRPAQVVKQTRHDEPCTFPVAQLMPSGQPIEELAGKAGNVARVLGFALVLIQQLPGFVQNQNAA